MQPVEVTARFSADGQVTPLQVTHNGRVWRVHAIGRRWQDSDGLHILVMLAPRRTVELIYRNETPGWLLKTPLGGRDAPV